METGDYGYVFQPRQAIQSRDWRPYTNGHWIYTDAGWTWISDEPFGWATYHYGRWIRLRSLGWVWVPGEQWAPAWVSWRKGNSYVGWAPLPPEAQFDRQTGIHNWADNYYDIGPEHYTFVPAEQFGGKLNIQVILPPERNVTIIHQTINVTNITYNNSVVIDQGPSYEELRAQSTQPIERFRLERSHDLADERPTFHGDVVALPSVEVSSGGTGQSAAAHLPHGPTNRRRKRLGWYQGPAGGTEGARQNESGSHSTAECSAEKICEAAAKDKSAATRTDHCLDPDGRGDSSASRIRETRRKRCSTRSTGAASREISTGCRDAPA